MENFCHAGGAPAVLAAIADRLDLDAPTVTGPTLGAGLAGAAVHDARVILPVEAPLRAAGGRAVVFEGPRDLGARIDDPGPEGDATSVFVLKGAGPQGYPGMAAIGNLPLPTKLTQAAGRDRVRLSEARMSGTAHGTAVLPIAPEAAAGGPPRWWRTATGSRWTCPVGA
jgi:dihydroxy-acid dehydratase